MTIDEFIAWLLRQIEKDDCLTEEQQKRLHERIFPAEEGDSNEKA